MGAKAKLRNPARAGTFGFLVLTVLAGAGCSDLFVVHNPASLTTPDLEDPSLVAALANSSAARVCAQLDDAAYDSGLQSDEFSTVSSLIFTQDLNWGQMDGYNTAFNSNWDGLASGRWVADDMRRRLEKAVASPNSDRRIADAIFWSAEAQVTMAELFREVPEDGQAPQKPDAILEKALAMFDQVAQIAAAAGDVNLRAAAIGAKARVYRSLYFERGKQTSYFTSAVQAAQQALALKPDFSVVCTYAYPATSNAFSAAHLTLTGNFIDPTYAELKDPVSRVKDPRIAVGPPEGPAPAPHTGQIRRFLKYPGRDADFPVSRAAEARLILAEGQLLTGDLAQAVNQINLVRAVAKLPAFSGTTAAAVDAQLKYERAVELFGEGRRLQDHRYYNIVPWEWEAGKKLLGTNRRWPVSDNEVSANPYYHR